jgi:hypothetical protein
MSRILTVTISALMLAGCATGYDKSAMPKAAANLQQEAGGCKTKWEAKEFKTYSELQACYLTAQRGFFRSIALTKMDAFEVYAADMQALAADWDAHRVTDRQARPRAKEIQWKFFADCGCKPRGHLSPSSAGPYSYEASGPSGDVQSIAAAHVDNPFEAPH